ncbi:helix-turn-helix domain-containing protein [Allosalinactinospora lopnorensis]|uniref:helix-turn-helix domain-containing protein n=1 Tax=Allosalinactinospora lopnorensis TaxID=1352348 RepID=UPI000623EEDF|nr:helix-turn-helix domain-containing protein [Allosalinactinospora lopnorensis]
MKPQASLADPAEVAEYLKIPMKTLAMWRYRQIGPKWRRVGRHIRYRWSDIEKWLDQQSGDAA